MNKIKKLFDKQFKHWNITLPEQDLAEHKRGKIQQSGWLIQYRFDKENGVEFVEFFASHRMTDSTINHIYADGREEVVAEMVELVPVGDEKLEKEISENNKQFSERVSAGGFD